MFQRLLCRHAGWHFWQSYQLFPFPEFLCGLKPTIYMYIYATDFRQPLHQQPRRGFFYATRNAPMKGFVASVHPK